MPHELLVEGFGGTYQIVVSGGRHLLHLDTFRGTDVVEPRTFYERLDL